MSDPIENAINAEHARQERAWEAYSGNTPTPSNSVDRLREELEHFVDIVDGTEATGFDPHVEQMLMDAAETARAALAMQSANPTGSDELVERVAGALRRTGKPMTVAESRQIARDVLDTIGNAIATPDTDRVADNG